MVFSLAWRMLSDRHLAEDLAQEVFLQFHRNLQSVDSAGHLRFWLRRVTVNRAIDQLRRKPGHETASLDETAAIAAEHSESDALLQQRLRYLVSQLPATPRAVMVLRYQEDLDPKDIAGMLSMSIHTVKSHLKRSIAILREQMGEVTPAIQAELAAETQHRSLT
jgi:RNA polymerase sigma-70 factor (ECF subfamily)